MKALTEKLKEKKLKVTPQRLAIYHILYNTNKHPCAEIIYNTLKSSYPTISLATVYKTLDTLKKADLVQELNVGEDSFRYDANTNPHPHFSCKICHNVFDIINFESLKTLRDDIASTNDFEIESEQIYFFGTCKTCQKKRKKFERFST